MSTPTATDAANAAASTLAILKPTDDEVEEEGVASGGHRIGLYTPRSRRLMLDRYLLKRSKRLSRHKWFKYPVRKTLADTRPRVKGRFVKHDLIEDEDGDVSPPRKGSSRDKANDEFEANMAGFDYIQAFALCVKESKDAVDSVVIDILRNKQRKGELISWDSWTLGLEASLTALLPREYATSPFPAIFGELVYILGDAEEDANQANFCRALQAGAIYVAVCLSLFTATHSPKAYESRLSPILSHYSHTTKKLWQVEPNVQKKHTFAMMKSIVDGIAGVIAVGYHDGKQYLKPVSVPQILDDGTVSEGSASS